MLSREDDPHLEAARRRRNQLAWRGHQRALGRQRLLRKLRGAAPIILLLGAVGALGVSSARWRVTTKSMSAPHNCAEARAMGIAPMHRGQPGYAPHLDADGDGIACEPWLEQADRFTGAAARHR